MLLKTSKY